METSQLILLTIILSGCQEKNYTEIQFKLAEEESAPGLIEMKLAGTDEIFYLHQEIILDNSHVKKAESVMILPFFIDNG